MEKLYYSIAEVSVLLKENASTLRFWEKEFTQLRPKVSARGVRQYTEADIELLRRICFLLREQDLTIEGAKKRIKVKDETMDVRIKDIEKLQKVRNELMAIRRDINSNETTQEDIIL